ncbi:hypothetical protein E4T48_04686 [Aureobasidium sp. EXF-10727]|nr:hypothetical protein E4T48_04686 [Aureobasidium sp. EXF-10727]
MSGNNLHSIAESSPVPRRKRKRTSDVTAENISVAQPIKSSDEFERALHSPATKKQPPRKVKRLSYSSQDQDSAEDDDEDSADSDPDAAEDNPKDTVESFEDPQPSANGHDEETLGHGTNGTAHDTSGSLHEDDTMHDVEASVNGEQDSSDQQPTQTTGLGDAAEQSGDTQANEPATQVSVGSQEEPGPSQEGDDAERDYDEDADLDISRDELTLPKRFGIETLDPTPVVSATASPAGSNQDSNVDQESPTKQLASILVGGAPTASQDGDKPVKRLPGRRRAPHANPKVEAALRRQLHLRMAYRAVAKNLKPILAELAKRSVSNIHKDPEAYQSFSEYPVVKNGLDEHFEKRLAWIQKQKDLNKQRLNDILEEQTAMRKRNYEHVAQNIKDDMIIRLQHDFLNTLRQQQQAEDDEYSDDEGDDVIPSLRRVTAKGALRGILGPEYHWRSRPALETERLFNEMYERHELARDHLEHDEASALEDPRPFTTFDPVVRDAADAQRRMRELLAALGEAAEEVAKPPPVPIVEAPPAIPVIPNNEALGLLMLAEASTTVNITTPAQFASIPVPSMDPPSDVPSRQDNLSVPRPSMSRAGSVAPSTNTPAKPLEEAVSEQRFQTTAPISFSQAVLEPSTTQTAPLFPRNTQREQQEQRPQLGLPQLPPIGQVVASQSHAESLPQSVVTSSSLPTPSKPIATDFWSSLAVSNIKTNPQGKAEHAPKAVVHQISATEQPASSGADNAKMEERESRSSLPASSTPLESVHQTLRNTSDSFGPLLERAGDLDESKPRKMPAPKKSLYGPWPRSRNYNPLDRRASTTSTAPPQPSLPGIHPRPSSGLGGTGPYSTAESRHTNYAPAPPPQLPGFPNSAPQSGPYGPAPIYGAAPPPPFAYEQRGPYPSITPYPPPAGFAGLPGQGPPAFYGGPHNLPPPPQQQGGYGPPPITSRPPPTQPAYGQQYGGQPILPANHDPRFGPNGQAASNNAGPAFAQYQQHDGRRRRNQSLGNREFQHYHGPR